AVKPAAAFGPRTEQRRDRHAVATPGGVPRQFGIGVDLDPPRLVVAEVPVQDIELVPGEDGEELLDLLARIKAPRHVEMTAAPAHFRRVLDAAGGGKGKA